MAAGFLFLAGVFASYFWYSQVGSPDKTLTALIFLLFLPWMARGAIRTHHTRFSQPRRAWIYGLSLGLVILQFLHRYFFGMNGRVKDLTLFNPGSDQWHYYNMIHKILSWSMGPRDYNYGLGYPLLGAFFSPFYSADPLLPVNLLCYVVGIFFLYKLMLRTGLGERLIYFTVALSVLGPYLIGFMVTPWTSSVSFMAYTIILDLSLREKRSAGAYLTFGLVTGLLFLTRYVDIVLALPIGAVLIWQEWNENGGAGLKKVSGGVLALLTVIAGVFISHKLILGGFLQNPYQWHHHPGKTSTDGDITYYLKQLGPNLWVHLYSHLVEDRSFDSTFFTHRYRAIFHFQPLFFFAPLGLWYWFKDQGFDRLRAIGIVTGVLLFLLIYGAHPGTIPGCQINGSLHYFKPLFPILLFGGTYYGYLLFTDSATRGRCIRHGLVLIASCVLITALLVGFWQGGRTI